MSPDTADASSKNTASAVYKRLAKTFDTTHGGFGGAPKFPSPSQTLHFLARYAAFNPEAYTANVSSAVNMASQTLVNIYDGGIHDHIGQGFARYSVDDHWHVPHCKYRISIPSSTSNPSYRYQQSKRCCKSLHIGTRLSLSDYQVGMIKHNS